jgi:hypothetical protein
LNALLLSRLTRRMTCPQTLTATKYSFPNIGRSIAPMLKSG